MFDILCLISFQKIGNHRSQKRPIIIFWKQYWFLYKPYQFPFATIFASTFYGSRKSSLYHTHLQYASASFSLQLVLCLPPWYHQPYDTHLHNILSIRYPPPWKFQHLIPTYLVFTAINAHLFHVLSIDAHLLRLLSIWFLPPLHSEHLISTSLAFSAFNIHILGILSIRFPTPWYSQHLIPTSLAFLAFDTHLLSILSIRYPPPCYSLHLTPISMLFTVLDIHHPVILSIRFPPPCYSQT